MPIKIMYYQLRKAKHFAQEAAEVIPDSELVRTGYKNIENTGVFTKGCYELRMLPPTSKTWKSLKFTLPSMIKIELNRKNEGTTQSGVSILTKFITE